MQTVNISEFRANLLKYLEVANSGETISVTSNGKLIATVTAPISKKDDACTQLKQIAATARIHDIVTPTDCEWDVSR